MDRIDEVLKKDSDYLRETKMIRSKLKTTEATMKKEKATDDDLNNSIVAVEGACSPSLL